MGQEPIEVLFDADRIASRVTALGQEIARGELSDLLIVVILKGSFVFAGDLIRAIEAAGTSARVDFMTLSSYGSKTESSGNVRVVHDLSEDVEGQTVLIVDDILESGRTIAHACDLLRKRKAADIKTCLLLDKPEKRLMDIEADYLGFEIGDIFVVGYGLDFANKYRGLPYIGSIRAS